MTQDDSFLDFVSGCAFVTVVFISGFVVGVLFFC